MRTLELKHPHLSGGDVGAWQSFLTHKGYSPGRIDNDFGNHTYNATAAFQRNNHLYPDGIVGPKTLHAAQMQGFSGSAPPHPAAPHPSVPRSVPPHPPAPLPAPPPVSPAPPSSGGNGNVPQNSTTYPARPTNIPSPTLQNAIRLFGSFSYVSNPSTFNGRGITITDNWERQNIITINIPQLRGVPIYGTRGSGNMRVHRLAANQMRQLFQAWENAGILHFIRTFSGAFAPRFIGGTKTLSNHAFGAAFDINEQWNGQPRTPAATGTAGSLRELVPIANSLGFYWGGHYSRRPDGMHFEVVVIR